jgi:hypothetical protein|tara:strand:- start:407 stop:1081 length:675 start_codon:yes stop_codon:yes gene_type:complete
MKVCKTCQQSKPITEYRVRTYKPSGNRVGGTYPNLHCRDCERAEARKRYWDNHEEYKRRSREYARNMTDEQKARAKQNLKEWKKTEKGKAYKKRSRKKLQQNPQYRLIKNYRKRLDKALKGKFTSKCILGCDWKQFQSHIESQFTNQMSWENKGDYWDLDHIIPLSAAKIDGKYDRSLLLELNNWQNFQPLESVYNQQIKSDNIPICTTLWSKKINKKVLGNVI